MYQPGNLELLDLPAELLQLILLHCSTPSFLQLSRTCRTIYDLASSCREVVFTHLRKTPGLQTSLDSLSTEELFLILKARTAEHLYGANFHSDLTNYIFKTGIIDNCASALREGKDPNAALVEKGGSRVLLYHIQSGEAKLRNILEAPYERPGRVKIVKAVFCRDGSVAVLQKYEPIQLPGEAETERVHPFVEEATRPFKTAGYHLIIYHHASEPAKVPRVTFAAFRDVQGYHPTAVDVWDLSTVAIAWEHDIVYADRMILLHTIPVHGDVTEDPANIFLTYQSTRLTSESELGVIPSIVRIDLNDHASQVLYYQSSTTLYNRYVNLPAPNSTSPESLHWTRNVCNASFNQRFIPFSIGVPFYCTHETRPQNNRDYCHWKYLALGIGTHPVEKRDGCVLAPLRSHLPALIAVGTFQTSTGADVSTGGPSSLAYGAIRSATTPFPESSPHLPEGSVSQSQTGMWSTVILEGDQGDEWEYYPQHMKSADGVVELKPVILQPGAVCFSLQFSRSEDELIALTDKGLMKWDLGPAGRGFKVKKLLDMEDKVEAVRTKYSILVGFFLSCLFSIVTVTMETLLFPNMPAASCLSMGEYPENSGGSPLLKPLGCLGKLFTFWLGVFAAIFSFIPSALWALATMESHANDLQPQILLQSKDHGELLNVIDLLRSQGVSRYVHLPQLIVCGDQSSGKSSVLEAVSGIRFPAKENLCTQFATELILRRAAEEKVTVEIIPGAERSEEEKKKLAAFSAPIAHTEDVPSIIEAAKKVMGLDTDMKSISDDILRVEICGPRQSHLTLVDLPGVVHSETRQHSTLDVAMISSLVNSYMANRRSIILAVVSASNDLAVQVVTKLARNHDLGGRRTLGIITKPDMLPEGSDNERDFVALARNENVVFRLGWHVLRNRDYKTKGYSAQERNELEKQFFSQGVWTALPSSILGIEALKPRLSAVLRDQIISELPNLTKDVSDGIAGCERTLAKLGEPRSTSQEQRLHLARVSQTFTSLIQAAIDGVYSHDFFGDARSVGDSSRRLRAVVRNTLTDFSSEMRQRGQKTTIVEDGVQPEPFALPPQITRTDFIKEVCELMKQNRARELPGTFNPLVIGDLFFEHASRWDQIVQNYAEKILKATREFLKVALAYCSDDATQQALMVEIIGPAMEKCANRLNDKIAEILWPYTKSHPITYNHYFIENLQKIRQAQTHSVLADKLRSIFGSGGFITGSHNVEDLISSLNRVTEYDMDRYAASEAVHCMEAYYKVAMKVLVDNFAVLAIERCVLAELPRIFTPEVALTLDDKALETIAAETEESKIERRRNLEKLERLRSGLQILTRLAFHRDPGLWITGSSSFKQI
ncbi:predicted protein [Uncinocarpus reesii 1704]|uniref:F-box domain-containing protein n=1 Tax=Uncinocarpus reesii (strain UAMH 1704) TaxID=336963 RepID=C4JGS7_UNCRE|nr:uncharacterized protein UREG_02589 [Uncinocarpus reesii 1704]EEP77740.1 predicted protein [Uncinocarpus reesii 1704]